jgi:hypothetical protein
MTKAEQAKMDDHTAHCQHLHVEVNELEMEIARLNRLLEILANASCEVIRIDGTIQNQRLFGAGEEAEIIAKEGNKESTDVDTDPQTG